MSIEPPNAESSCYNDLQKKYDFSSYKMGLKDLSNLVNHKIKGLALSKIPLNKYGIICGHKIATSPQVVFNILPKGFDIKSYERRKKQDFFSKTILSKQKKNPLEEYYLKRSKKHDSSYPDVPIGIRANSSNNWINAFLQLIIFIPSFRRIFNYTSKSFVSFNDFIDIYLYDQEQKKEITSASNLPIIEIFSRCTFNKDCFQNKIVDFFSILSSIMELIFPKDNLREERRMGGDLLALFPRGRISIEDEDIDLEKYILRYLQNEKMVNPLELLINFQWFLKKATRVKSSECRPSMILNLFDEKFFLGNYELDAFIEYRPDEFNSAEYLAYLKVDGLWFQCNDIKIRQVRSSNLLIPLSRSFLFHYKKINLAEDSKKLV